MRTEKEKILRGTFPALHFETCLIFECTFRLLGHHLFITQAIRLIKLHLYPHLNYYDLLFYEFFKKKIGHKFKNFMITN